MGDIELKDCQQEETEGKMQFHPFVTLMKCIFASLRVCNLKQIYYKVNKLYFVNQRLLLKCLTW